MPVKMSEIHKLRGTWARSTTDDLSGRVGWQAVRWSAVASLKSHERLAEVHAESLERLVPAFERLYARTPAAQERLADEVSRENVEKWAPERTGGGNPTTG
jgi:hypothetical protein